MRTKKNGQKSVDWWYDCWVHSGKKIAENEKVAAEEVAMVESREPMDELKEAVSEVDLEAAFGELNLDELGGAFGGLDSVEIEEVAGRFTGKNQ